MKNRNSPGFSGAYLMAMLVSFLASVGCTPMNFTRFEHPIVDEGGAGVDPELIGRWRVEQDPDGSVDIIIAAAGDITVTEKSDEAGKPPEVTRLKLVTARLGNLNVASIRTGPDDDDSWAYFHYWFPEPGVLSYAADDTKFWKDAVRNKMVAGSIERHENGGEGTTITASGAELRAFVKGYGNVIFSDAEDGRNDRLRRIPGGS